MNTYAQPTTSVKKRKRREVKSSNMIVRSLVKQL